jgi:cytochrome oxidase Cu insertion factor (SCO1/SenC/PrrC family)
MNAPIRRGLVAALLFSLGVASSAAAQLRPREGDLKVGDPVPALTLKDRDGAVPVSLTELKGKPAVLIFGSCT